MRTLQLDTNQLNNDLQVLCTDNGSTLRLSMFLLHNNQFSSLILDLLLLWNINLLSFIVDLGNNTFTGRVSCQKVLPC